MTTDEVAARLRTPKETLRHWRRKRVGPPAFKIGRRVYYVEADVEAFIRAARQAGGEE